MNTTRSQTPARGLLTTGYGAVSKLMRYRAVKSLVTVSLLAANAVADERILPGHVPPVVASLKPTGNLAATDRLHLTFALPLRNRDILDGFLVQLYTPQSPVYRQYLSCAQFTDWFGPTQDDYRAVIAFGTTNSLVLTRIHDNRLLVEMEGHVADVEAAFHVRMLEYQHPSEPQTFFAPDRDPVVPSSLPILDIGGFSSFERSRPNSGSGPVQPDGNRPYWGFDYRRAYVPGVTLDGQGQVVGIYAQGDPLDSDIQGYQDETQIKSYRTGTGLSSYVPIERQYVDPTHAVPDLYETTYDTELVISMAPGLSKVVLYETAWAPSQQNPLAVLNQMATDKDANGAPKARVLTSSFTFVGYTSREPFDNIFLQMAAQGQSFFESSGDGNAWCVEIPIPQDSPYVTIVGGTTLTMNGAGDSWSFESVWNDGPKDHGWCCNDSANNLTWGSGGGISSHYALPYWQQGIYTAQNYASTNFRNVPDVAIVATNGWLKHSSAWQIFEGTSMGAPLWAGFTTLVNQNAAVNGKAPVGFLNPALYALGKMFPYPYFFHDITTGNNRNVTGCSPDKFDAVAGYDLATGWGSPLPNVITGLLNPDCPLTPFGLVSWWPGQGNTLDNQSNNNGVAEGGLSYAAGEVNQAFLLNGDIRDF